MAKNHLYSMPTRNFSTSDKGCTNIALTLCSVQCMYGVMYDDCIGSSYNTMGEYGSVVQAGGNRYAMWYSRMSMVLHGIGRVGERMGSV